MRFWPRRDIESKDATLAAPDDDLLALFGVTTGPIAVSKEQALTVPAVNRAIRLISEACATLARSVMLVGADGNLEPDEKHPAAKLLLHGVNAWTPTFDFIRDLVAQTLTSDAGGLAWVNRVDGKPIEVIHYRPGKIQVTVADTGEMQYRLSLTSGARELRPADVIHLRNPFSKCPLSLAANAIGVAHHMEGHAGRLFKNGARPSGVVSFPKGVRLGEKGDKNFRRGFDQAYAGVENAGKILRLWDGAEWKPMILTSTDAQFQELRVFQNVEIARAFGVPPGLLFELDRQTWSNGEQQAKEFLSYSLEGHLQALEGALAFALFTPEERERYRVVFDRDDLTRVSLTERATAINSLRASEVISANESRAWLDMSPRAGGDEFKNPNITTTKTTTTRGRDE
jgi:HK97 family phage portal protein